MNDESTGTSSTAETKDVAPGPPVAVDPPDRFGLGDLSSWPAWFGRRWPDRLFGEIGSMGDHIKVEEFLDDGTLVVRAEIPGVDPESDIDISIDGGRLAIRATRTSRFEDDADGYRSEFRYGSFSRVMSLPPGADTDEVAASYNDGILEVRIPMPESHEKKRVAVTRG